jgi:hypothetical protein
VNGTPTAQDNQDDRQNDTQDARAPAAEPVLRQLTLAGGPFESWHRARLGPAVDLGDLAPAVVPPLLLPEMRAAWQARVRSEFRSIQIMTRFLTEVTGAGDPLDVYTAAAELVADEIRHAELCAAVCRRLEVAAPLPEPLPLPDAPGFLALPYPERALSTAITMLVVNESISTAIIRDLLERCDYPPVRRVLQATVEDEDTHGNFGWDYVAASLTRFDRQSRSYWRRLTLQALEPHRAFAARGLSGAPAAGRSLSADDERELARYGLLSPQRQALLFERTLAHEIGPRLRQLGLLAPDDAAPAART